MTFRKLRLNKTTIFWAFLSAASLPAYGEEICSSEGKSNMRAANVTEAQIAKICPVTTVQPKTVSVDYRDVQSAVLDGSNAVGKTISLNALYRELGTFSTGPYLLTKVDTNTSLSLWYVFFDRSFASTVSGLRSGQRLSVVCRITELHSIGPKCDLIKLSIN